MERISFDIENSPDGRRLVGYLRDQGAAMAPEVVCECTEYITLDIENNSFDDEDFENLLQFEAGFRGDQTLDDGHSYETFVCYRGQFVRCRADTDYVPIVGYGRRGLSKRETMKAKAFWENYNRLSVEWNEDNKWSS